MRRIIRYLWLGLGRRHLPSVCSEVFVQKDPCSVDIDSAVSSTIARDPAALKKVNKVHPMQNEQTGPVPAREDNQPSPGAISTYPRENFEEELGVHKLMEILEPVILAAYVKARFKHNQSHAASTSQNDHLALCLRANRSLSDFQSAHGQQAYANNPRIRFYMNLVSSQP